MAEKSTAKRKAAKKSSRKPLVNKNAEIRTTEVESGNSLIEKIFPSLIVASVSAIFYFTGWVYIAHWYSYYGIDATLINIPLQVILLHGFPGILALGISGLMAILGTNFFKNFISQSSLEFEDIPKVIIFAYLISLAIILVILITINVTVRSVLILPDEAWISTIGLLLIMIAFQIRSEFRNSLKTIAQQKTTRSKVTDFFTKALIKALPAVGLINIGQQFRELFKDGEFEKQIDKIIDDTDEYFRFASEFAMISFERAWRIWISAILLFYFLISISISAILGEWDAARGARFMIGNWHIPEISLYSTSSIPALASYENKNGNNFEYKPLGLLTSTDKVYYLVDVKGSPYYTKKPNVYIVPRSDSLVLNFIVAPYARQFPSIVTPTQSATSVPPLVMPTSTP